MTHWWDAMIEQGTVAEICALPVRECASSAGANLFLWTTNRYLHDAFHVAEAWGFTYRQTVVWLKDRRSPFVASVAPNHAEFLLVARCGSIPFSGSFPSSVIEVAENPRARRHSAKPEAFLDLIERTSPGPYLEMFARRQRLGWDTWGNEALNHVEIAS